MASALAAESFLCGEGEVDLLRSKAFSGDSLRDCADLSLALVTVLVAKVGSLALIELQVSRHPASFLLVDGAHQGAGSLANNFNL